MNWNPKGIEVKSLVTQFLDALSHIIIQRKEKDGTVVDQIEVNIVYAPKQRVLYDLINKNQHITIPVISCYITNFARDPQRVFNKIQGSTYNMLPATSGSEQLLQPLPINITMGVSIICRYQTDLDIIMGNIFAYFDPYIIVSWLDPVLNFTEVRSTVRWSESVNIQYPLETAANQPTRIIADTSFTIAGWLYKKELPDIGKIYKITTNFASVSELEMSYSLLTALQTPDSTDTFVISAIPQIQRVFPDYSLTGVETEFMMVGSNFNFKDHFLSGMYAVPMDNNIYPTLTYFDPLSDQPTLSAKYPPFSGVRITDYTIESDNIVTFTLPSAVGYGHVDILTFNTAGYSRLTDAQKPNTLLWAGSGGEYWQSSQDKSVLGIEIKPTEPLSGIGIYNVGSTFVITSS